VRRGTLVTPNTPFMSYSCTKAFTGACVHRLIEEGKVNLDARIADYWPEFGCKGKETATVRHAFLHQAGLPNAGLYVEALLCWNWDIVTRYVANLPSEYPPGSQCVYHLVNYGYLLGEVVRRVSGQRIDHYMQQLLFDPLGLKNSYLGIPRRELGRAAHIYLGHPEQSLAVNAFNLPFVRGAVIPAASLNTTARDLATFYQMVLNRGTYAGKQILHPATIDFATSLGYNGPDNFGNESHWGHGFHLGGEKPRTSDAPVGMGHRSTTRTFGHFGQASCMAWADFDADIAVTFTCNRLLQNVEASRRWEALSEAVWQALKD
jgi:CubicO group peptidase (beta-lactamase class C family)